MYSKSNTQTEMHQANTKICEKQSMMQINFEIWISSPASPAIKHFCIRIFMKYREKSVNSQNILIHLQNVNFRRQPRKKLKNCKTTSKKFYRKMSNLWSSFKWNFNFFEETSHWESQKNFFKISEKMRCNRRMFGKWTAIFLFFTIFTYWMYFLILCLDLQHEKFPNTLSELKSIHHNFKNKPAIPSLIFFCSLFLYEQTFCIPGCMFLSILAGNFYGLIYGTLITSVLTGLGGTFSYVLSKYTICEVVNKIFNKHVRKLRQEYEKNTSPVGSS